MISTVPDACTCCTACSVSCPVAAVTPAFRGPKQLGPALQRFRLSQQDQEASLELCSGCRSCDVACPSGVPIASLNMLARARERRGHALRDRLLTQGEAMARLAVPLAPLANAVLASAPARAALRLCGVGGGAPLPRYASRTFSSQLRRLRLPPLPEQVVLFPGCFVQYNQPSVGLDVAALLRAAGVEAIVPDGMGCCGAPAVSSGFLGDAEERARRNVRALLPWVQRGLRIVTPCPTCTLMLGEEYLELFDLPGSAEVAGRVLDAGELLAELVAAGRLRLPPAARPARILYHAPCHQRARGRGLPGLDLLRKVGIDAVEANAGCCGIAGSYGFKTEKVPIAMEVGRRLFARVAEAGAEAVASECGTCRVQIAHATSASTVHPVTLLRQVLEGEAWPEGFRGSPQATAPAEPLLEEHRRQSLE